MRLDKRSVTAILIAGVLAAGAGAQTRKGDVKREAKRSDERAAPSVSLVERAPGYLSGEANVAVSGNQNPVIRLGLSPNGATIIEFPASDRLFNIIPGNSDLVTVEESPTKETDRFIIVRPGDGFASPATMAQARRAPATSVIVQMTSGLVITFLFYPVPQLAEQAHRVVVTYDRNEVIATRRAAGLAVNLDSGAEQSRPKSASLRITSPQDASARGAARNPEEEAGETQRNENASGGGGDERTPGEKAAPRSLEESRHDEPLPPLSKQKRIEYVNAASEALARALKHPEGFKYWGKEAHGLAISALPARELDGRAQVAVFAVRNSRKAAARILPGQPEIDIETLNDKGGILNVQTVKKIGQHTDASPADLIPGKSVQYYAIAYEAPILGARQRLRIAVATTNAADEPAIVGLIR